MSTIRVFELAQELGVPPGELMNRLRKMGLSVKSHSSTIDRLVAAQLAGTPLRVHEVARELHLPAKELAERLQSMGVTIKSHMSMVEPDVLGRLAAAEPPAAPSPETAASSPESKPPAAPAEPRAPAVVTPSAPEPAPPSHSSTATSSEVADELPAPASVEVRRDTTIEELAGRADRLARLMRAAEEHPTSPADSETGDVARTEIPTPRVRRTTLLHRLERAPGGRLFLSLLIVAIVAGVLVSNLPTSYTAVVARRSAGRALVNAGLYQGWNMFAPDPPLFNIRLIAVVRFSDGTRSTWSPPVENRFTGAYRDYRWRRSDSINSRDSAFYNGVADWLARRFGKETGRRAIEVIFYHATADSPPPGNTSTPQWKLQKIRSVTPLLGVQL